jgi:PAS domain-containing protein
MRLRQVQRNERNLALIVDSIPGLVVRMSATGEVELANRQLLSYFGKELEDIRNWATSGVVHPEDLPRAIEIAGNSFATGDPYEMEIRVRRYDGVYSTSAMPMKVQPTVLLSFSSMAGRTTFTASSMYRRY